MSAAKEKIKFYPSTKWVATNYPTVPPEPPSEGAGASGGNPVQDLPGELTSLNAECHQIMRMKQDTELLHPHRLVHFRENPGGWKLGPSSPKCHTNMFFMSFFKNGERPIMSRGLQ